MKLLDYIRGVRKGKEAHRLEKESMRDPFLADAMDGYQQVEGNHEERIKKLHHLVTTRSNKKRNTYAITWSIAASLIIGMGISCYFLFLKNSMPEDAFIAKETTDTTTIAPGISIDPIAPKEEFIHSSSAAKKRQDSSRVTATDKEIKKDIIAKSKVAATPQSLSAKVSAPVKEKNMILAKAEERGHSISTTDTFILYNNEKDPQRLKQSANLPNMIKGTVTDEEGQPLVGVNITFGTEETDNKDQSLLYDAAETHEGKIHKTITDINGQFTVPREQCTGQLKVNYVGYDPVCITVKDSIQSLLIAMKESKHAILDEVIIAGTGAQKKITVTGAVTSVDVDVLRQAPSSNALAGSIAGVIKGRSTKTSKEITPKPVIGIKKYKKYLKKNLTPPTDEICGGMKGSVILTFSVSKKGRPIRIKVKKGLCESADKEAIRLIQEGPDWTYGNTPAEVTVKFK